MFSQATAFSVSYLKCEIWNFSIANELQKKLLKIKFQSFFPDRELNENQVLAKIF